VIFGEDGLGREPDETAVLDPAALVGAAAIIGLEIAQGRGGEGGEEGIFSVAEVSLFTSSSLTQKAQSRFL
jgi:hypothetical protein